MPKIIFHSGQIKEITDKEYEILIAKSFENVKGVTLNDYEFIFSDIKKIDDGSEPKVESSVIKSSTPEQQSQMQRGFVDYFVKEKGMKFDETVARWEVFRKSL